MKLSIESAWAGRVRLIEADARPGRYYVTARDEAGRTAFLLGPFNQATWGKGGHARALGRLRAARLYVRDNYPRSMGWVYGTCWMPLTGPAPVGKLEGLV